MPNLQTQPQIKWEEASLKKFTLMIEKIPLFHRNIAHTVVRTKAELNAGTRGSALVEEEDILRAFFSEVPLAFYSLMVRILDEVGFDYRKYEPQ